MTVKKVKPIKGWVVVCEYLSKDYLFISLEKDDCYSYIDNEMEIGGEVIPVLILPIKKKR